MVYRRKTYRRGGYRKKRYTRRGAKSSFWRSGLKYGTMGLAKVGIKMLKKRLGLNTENKYWDDVQLNTATATLTAHSTPMANIAQGNTAITRNGNGIRVTHLKFKGSVQGIAANPNNQLVRVIVTYQKSDVDPGNFVSSAQILQFNNNIYSPYNSDLQGVKILYDHTFNIQPKVASAVTTVPFTFTWSPGYDEGHVTWTDADTTGSSTNMIKGLVRVFFYCDQLANFPVLNTYTRCHYVDN